MYSGAEFARLVEDNVETNATDSCNQQILPNWETNPPTDQLTDEWTDPNKKKIDKGINFLRGGEKKMVSIFHLRRCAEVGLSWDFNGAGPEIDT